MNIENDAKIFEVLKRLSDLFNQGLNQSKINFYKERLINFNPVEIEEALKELAESEKFFPTIELIKSKILEIRKTRPQSSLPCQRCKSSGTVILFHKETLESMTFRCRCQNGDRFNFMNSEEFQNDKWVPRHLFNDQRPFYNQEQRANRLNNYWESIIK